MSSSTPAPRNWHAATIARLSVLGLELPEPVTPVASYVPAVQFGALIQTSGQLPINDGKLPLTGKVGDDVSEYEAAQLARICILNALAAISSLADLDSISRVIKVVGFVASAPNFNAQPAVINGASDLLLDVFGERGRHARAAVGVAELPLAAPVEIELLVETAS